MTTLIKTADKATYIASGVNAEKNSGAAVTVIVSTQAKGLLYFDLSSIPAGATCVSAVLSLFSAMSASSLVHTLWAILVGNADWPEGTAIAAIQVGSCDWNHHTHATQNWAGAVGLGLAGTDYNAVALGTIAYPASSANAEATLALSPALVETWFGAGNANYGLLLTGASISPRSWHSNEAANPAMWPTLTVEYAVPVPVVPGGPIPGQDVGLLVNTGTWSAPVFEPLAGQRVVVFGEGSEPIDWSSKDSRFRRIMGGRWSADVSAGGLYVPNDPPYLALQAACRGHELILIRRCEDGVPIEDAIALVKAISIDAPDNDVGLMAVGLVVDGWWFPAT